MPRQLAALASAIVTLAVTAALVVAALAAHPSAAAASSAGTSAAPASAARTNAARSSPALASAAPAPSWMVKGQDFLAWDPSAIVNGKRVHYLSIGLEACSQGMIPCPSNQRITLPSFTWRLCGRWGKHVYGLSDDTQCSSAPNRTLVFENYTRFQNAINDGLFSTLKMDKALFDLETWKYSGNDRANPNKWIRKALGLAHRHNIKLMITLGGGFGHCYKCMTTAANNGAYKVSVQSQGATTLAAFKGHVRGALNAIGNNKSLLIVGLGTNTPVVHDVKVLRAEYGWARSIGLNQFWLNANNWQGRNKCTLSQGGLGCPQIGVQFLANP
jgi:hypothetical protein